MNHIGNTKRLRIFKAEIKPTPYNMMRTLFVAFRLDEDRPMVCVSCLALGCDEESQAGGSLPWVDWLEVSSECRRQGFAREFIKGISRLENRVLVLEGVTPDGKALCSALEKEREEQGGKK